MKVKIQSPSLDPVIRERDDFYPWLIAKPSARWRVILDRHALQFILQKRSTKTPNAGVWVGKSYCTTRDSLIDVCSHLGLLSDANTEAVLHALPDRARDYRIN